MTEKTEILKKLDGIDRRSIGESVAVVIEVLENPALFGEVFAGMISEDPVVRMRSADAIEKISARRPDLLQPYKAQMLGPLAVAEQAEVRWHVAQMLPRLDLNPSEVSAAVEILRSYLHDQSVIVRTFALQGFADLTKKDPELKPQVLAMIDDAMRSGSPAEKSRGRRLNRSIQSHKKAGTQL
jgi:hypothetical protein